MHVLVIKHVPPGPASLKQNNNGCLHPVNSTLDSVQDDVKDENGMLGAISFFFLLLLT
jgi:hypothetical protein